MEQFVFRNILSTEVEQAIAIEQICFPPNEACSPKSMSERIASSTWGGEEWHEMTYDLKMDSPILHTFPNIYP